MKAKFGASFLHSLQCRRHLGHILAQCSDVICIISIREYTPETLIPKCESARSIIQSIALQNKAGAKTKPCLTPDFVSKSGERFVQSYPSMCEAVEILNELQRNRRGPNAF